MSSPSLRHPGFLSRGLVRSAAWPARAALRVPGWAIASAVLLPVVMTGGWLVADALQPASYSPVRDTVSIMAGYAGTDRWVMTGALLLAGGCYLLTAAGLAGARRSARILLAVAGLASIGIATSPETAAGPTARHVAWTTLGAVTIAVWPAFAARRGSPRPLLLSVYCSAAVTAVFIALGCWFLAEAQGGGMVGLAERLSVSVQTLWPCAVALTIRHTTRPHPRDQTAAHPEPPG
jgi:hypothetical membrane protein